MTSSLRHYRLPGMAVTERMFSVPLNHADPTGARIEIFTVELVDPANADTELPYLVFFQGGPGGLSPRPLHSKEGWIGRALRSHRVLLIDQRGTGRSTPLTWREASKFPTAEALAQYLGFLRSDSIVADAEIIRARLSPDRPWDTLGQSYGGWITMSYLTSAPAGLRACYIGGGVPPLHHGVYELNLRTFPRVKAKVLDFYDRFPQDREILHRLRDKLTGEKVLLPGGERLSLERMRQVGRLLGHTDGVAKLHWLLQGAILPDGELSDTFLEGVIEMTRYAKNPLHPVLIDITYPTTGEAGNWPGARAMAQYPEFDPGADELLLTGEFVFPWMFEEIERLKPFAGAVEINQQRNDWAPIWDAEILSRNQVPVTAAIYHEDMYVDEAWSRETSARVPNMRHWITNEWQHDGLARSGGEVLDRLITMAADLHPASGGQDR
ncbi:alpha/beta fold hydrolase [Microbacterium arabinogalactanolyticum]|uniref:alpha/beta fold hydrolase n=1 Tax=Microbacterium arabinogalactanolyticum TaxID=69365 RepID=UPI004044643D